MWMADSHNGNTIQQAFLTFVAVQNLIEFYDIGKSFSN
jgi:hypothetical protein